jgi:hypothetical protein
MAYLDSPIISNYLFKGFKSGVPSIFETDEVIAPVHIAASISPPLKNIVSLKTLQLIESGIFMRTFNHYFKRDFPLKTQVIGPQILTTKHLSAGFVVICGLLVLCIFVFAAEWLTVLMKHQIKHRKLQVVNRCFKLMIARSKSCWRKWKVSNWRIDYRIFRVIWAHVKRFGHGKLQKSSNIQD